MEYVIFNGMSNLIYTVRYNEYDFEINYWGGITYETIDLPTDPCDLELFRDSLNEILTEVIEKKRSKKND